MKSIRARSAARILCAAAIVALLILAVGCGSSSKKAAAKTTVIDGATINSDSSLYDMLPANIKSAGVIKVASDIPYPPWEYFVSEGSSQATGFDYDLSQALGAKLGIKVAFIETKFDSAILSLQSHKNDMVMSDMYDNADREKQVDFVDYALDTTGIVVLKGNPQGVTSLDSLAGKTVACEKGTTQAVLMQDLNTKFQAAGTPLINIMQYPDQPSALLAVRGGKAVGDLTDHSTGEYVAKTQGGGGVFEVVVDPAAPDGYAPTLVGAAILKGNTQLVDAVQKALQALIDEGTYVKIIQTYSLVPVKSAQVNQGGLPSTASPTP
jgi:polar amino acid transport system substrate-binding protein